MVNFDQLIQSIGGKIPQFTTLGAIISGLLPILYAIAGIGLLLFLIAGGFRYLTSAGDPKKTESAKGTITTAIVGFVLVIVAYWLTQIVNYIFNLGAGF